MLAYYYAWRDKYKGLRPFEVKQRRREGRERRWAIRAVMAASLIVIIGTADMLIWPDAPASQDWSEPTDAHKDLVEPQATTAAAAVSNPVPAPAPERAEAAKPAVSPSAPGQRSLAPAGQPTSLGAGTTPVNAAPITRTDPPGYVVQVAAVPQLQEAQGVVDQLVQAGHPAYLSNRIVDGIELYRVRVGPFALRRVAEETARRLEGEGRTGLWVTK